MSDDPKLSTTKAAEAYYAISSHLADFTGETPSSKKTTLDIDDDEYGSEYISRRISGAFSPPAARSATTPAPASASAAHESSDTTSSSQWSARRASSETSSAFKSKESSRTPQPSFTAGAGSSSRLRRTSQPVETPANTSHLFSQTRDQEESSTKVSFEDSKVEEEEYEDSALQESSYPKSLRNDYQPYHDALHLLVKSRQLHPSKQLQARVSYCQLLRDSNYNLSLALQDKIQQGASLALDAATDTQSTYACEMEGHVWSLLDRLTVGDAIAADSAIATDSPMYQSDAMEPELPCMILWDEHHVQNSHHASLIQEWIQTLTRHHQSLDSVALTEVFDSCLRGEHELGASLPYLTQRRQLILDWIESCHNRSVIECYPVSSKERIMWKDTLDHLSRSYGYGRSNNGKVSSIHPDAPLILREESKSMGLASNATVQPLYGNDESRDVVLLSACLSLMKAGRYSDILEKCREFGQPWRVAAWSGNEVFGVVTVQDEMNDIENETVERSVRIGNPKRMLWKRNMWHVSQGMHNILLQTSGSMGDTASAKDMLASGSAAYEAAISAILADDTNAALENPILKRNWMDLVWVYFKGQQSRFMEQVYHSHNNIRRGNGDGNHSFLEGTEFEKEELEQLLSTQSMPNFDECSFVKRLHQTHLEQIEQDEGNIWRDSICSLLTGLGDIIIFLNRVVGTLSAGDTGSHHIRFVLHFLIFLEAICDRPYLSDFRELVVLPKQHKLLLLYINSLISQKSVWNLTGLYLSLLKDEEILQICTIFWANIESEEDRVMILKNARQHFGKGMELRIIRDVVRSCILSSSGDKVESNSSIATVSPASMYLNAIHDSSSYNSVLEKQLLGDDARKMYSIRWMCNFTEHYTDALVCSNMLLRQFLLDVSVSGSGKDEDWSMDTKLYTAKVFRERFLPFEIASHVSKNIVVTEEPNLEDSVTEHFALDDFLKAHSAYEKWAEIMTTLSPFVNSDVASGNFDGTLENEIAKKIDRKLFVDKKREIGSCVLEIAEEARSCFMKVLTFNGGWLQSSRTKFDTQEEKQRLEEMLVLRSKCIPLVVKLTFRILDGTAGWMKVFVQELVDVFGQDEGRNILHHIHGFGKKENEIGASPLLPETWHRMALLLSNTVASDEYGIVSCLNTAEIKGYLHDMAQTAVSLMRCKEQ